MGILDAVLPEFAAPFASMFKGIPSYLGADFTDGFTIEEVLPDDPAGGVVINLLGEWLPHQPFEWGGKQSLIKEYYPGNGEPTVQVLGARANNVRIKGRFKVKHLHTEFPATYREIPSILCDAIDAIRDRGSLVVMTLGLWQRWGFIEETDWKMKTLADIDYEIDFFVVGSSPPSQCKLSEAGFSIPDDDNLQLISAATNLEDLGTQPFDGINLGLFFQLNAAIGSVATALSYVTKFVSGALAVADNAESLANHAIGLIKYAQAQISVFKHHVGQLNAYLGSDPTAGLGLKTWDEPKNAKQAAYVTKVQLATSQPQTASPAQKAASTASAAKYTASASAQQQAAAKEPGKSIDALLLSMLKSFTAIAQQVPKARYLVKAGDTLQTVSVKFYGNPDQWEVIYKHNKLGTTVLVPGKVLEIPKQ